MSKLLETLASWRYLGVGEDREALFHYMLDSALVKGATFIDVGSSDGAETTWVIRKYGNAVRGILLEPDADTLTKVKSGIGGHCPAARVSFQNAGVSDFEHAGVLYRCLDRPNLSSAIKTQAAVAATVVKYTTLTRLCENYSVGTPVVIKMDIEGYEVEALRGFLEWAGSHSPVSIAFEVHPLAYTGERSLKAVLSDYFAVGYRTHMLETAGLVRPMKFRERGLVPIRTMSGRRAWPRGLYENLDNEFVLDVACRSQHNPIPGPRKFTEKIVRSLLLKN